MQLAVIDLLGKEILKDSFSVGNGGVVKNINLKNGVYVLMVTNDAGGRFSNKVIIR